MLADDNQPRLIGSHRRAKKHDLSRIKSPLTMQRLKENDEFGS